MALCVVTLLLFNLLFLAPAQGEIVPELTGAHGGWHEIDPNGQEAQTAASTAFGLWARRQPLGLAYRLGEVVSAQHQLVCGNNYKLEVIIETSVPGPANLWQQGLQCDFSLYVPLHDAPADLVDNCHKM